MASWRARAGAFAVDMAPGGAVVASAALLALAAPGAGWLRWVCTAVGATALLAMVLNRLVLPRVTGWTLGRALFGIAVRRSQSSGSGAGVGGGRLTLRESAHLLDTAALFVGWLWPLWDRRRRTFADLLARTEVHQVQRPRPDIRRLVAGVLIGAAVLCGGAAVLGYVQVYRPERVLDETRAQIAERGPRIVERMLSYDAKTLSKDFARAQSLATDGYRPELIAQQQGVLRQGQATTEKYSEEYSAEYSAVSSAVLNNPAVTPGRASMLVALQGRRGTNQEDLKFVTATVRVDFARSPDGQWRVADLTVLKKPGASQGAQ
ncbi:MAG: RDD family protein [Actinomycetia bacterium]|nr:RDD family protein [Actinomycetes bacterium]